MEQSFVQRWPTYLLEARPGIYRLMDDYARWLATAPPQSVQFAGDFHPNPGVNQAMASGATAAQRIQTYLRR